MVSSPNPLKNFWQFALDIIFPSICLHCRAYLNEPEEKENLLCDACFTGIKIYSNVFRPDPRFDLAAIGSYDDGALRELIHHLKYNGFLAAEIPLKKLTIKWLNTNPFLVSRILDSRPWRGSPSAAGSLLVPIPLHKNRLRGRGFNQAELIARILSRFLRLPMEKNLLERTQNTRPQVEMKNAGERTGNVKNSIRIKPGREVILSNRQNIILVDDVYTSGATMKEAVKTLRRAGAKSRITAFVLAKT